jgi:DNA-binding PadR family transcriptional regulator
MRSPADVLVLTMLVVGERHGNGIRQDILDHSRGRIELEAGSMYRHIRTWRTKASYSRPPRTTHPTTTRAASTTA